MKIEFESIGFKNFLSFGSKFQEVEFKKGVNLVTGFDKDRNKSNGAGKSSFLEVIPFVLFGKTARDIKKEQIINWKNRKALETAIRFKKGENVYEVIRAIKPDKFEIHKNGSLLAQEAHVRDYQGVLEEILGMDYKIAMSLIHSNVNSSSGNILSMSKPEKRKFMEKMFGLEIYSKMNELCNSKLRNIDQKISESNLKILSLDEKINSCRDMVVSFEIEIKKKKDISHDLDEAKKELDVLNNTNPKLGEEIAEATNEIREIEKRLNSTLSKIQEKKVMYVSDIAHIEKDLAKIEENNEQRKINKESKEKIEEIKREHGEIEVVRKRIEDSKESQKKYENELKDLDNRCTPIKKEIIEMDVNLKILSNNLETLKSGTCPVCKQPVEDITSHYKNEITTLKKEYSNKSKELEKITKEMGKVKTEIERFEKIIDEQSEVKDRLYRLTAKIKDIGSDEDKENCINQLKEKEEKVVKLKALEAEANKKADESKSKLSDKIDVLNKELSKVNDAEKKYNDLKLKVDSEKDNIKYLKDMIKERQNDIQKAKDEKINVASHIEKINNIKDYINCIKELIKDENIKQYTISTIMPFLNKQTNFYLSEVDYAFYVNIDKWLDVEIKGPGITKATYNSLSGGERRGIDLGMQFSFLDISMLNISYFPDILVLDELLDSSIDAKGLSEVLKIVKFKQKENLLKTFIISHRPELESDLIDNTYHVIKENSYSRVIVNG